MEIRYNTSENHKNTAVAIQEQLKPLGIEVTLLNTDTKTHYGYPRAEGRFRRRPRRLDRRLQGSGNLPRHLAQAASGNNYSNYNSPKFERADEEGRRRRRQSGGAHASSSPRPRRSLVDELGNIPLLFYSFHNIVSPKLKGWEDNVMDVHPSRFISKEG